MNCDHTQKKKVKRIKKVANEAFRYPADICTNCGAEFWNLELEKQFGVWLSKQKADKFKLQKVKISDGVYKCFADESLFIGKGDVSLVLRAVLNVYLQRIASGDGSSEIMDKIEQLYAQEKDTTFLSKGVKERSFRLNGRLYVDLEAFSRIGGLSMAQGASEILARMAVALKRHTGKVKSELDYVLRAS